MMNDDENWCAGYEKGYADALQNIEDFVAERLLFFVGYSKESIEQESHIRELQTMYEFIELKKYTPKN